MSNLLEKFDVKTILSEQEARVISPISPSYPFWEGFSPLWIFKMFDQCNGTLPIEGGSYVNNQVLGQPEDFLNDQATEKLFHYDSLKSLQSHQEGSNLPPSSAHYDTKPEIIFLQAIQSVVKFHTRIAHFFSNYYDQLYWQLKFATQTILETRENLFFNHPKHGLLQNIKHPNMMILGKYDPLMDVLDKMVAKVWRFGSADCFVMHPETLREFHSQCNKAGIKLIHKNIFGKDFTCWRDIPILTTNKIYLHYDTSDTSEAAYKSIQYKLDRKDRGITLTSILLIRIGEEKQGVIHLVPKSIQSHPLYPGMNIEFMGINDAAIASYLLTTYSAAAVTSYDALCRADVLI